MGVWALPQTTKQAKELQEIVAKPLSPKVATDKLYNLLGSDDLFDLIAEAEEKDGKDCDVRNCVEFSLREFLKDYLYDKESFNSPWDEEAFEICRNICRFLEKLSIERTFRLLAKS